MSTSQEAGSLVETLLILQRLGINADELESRPIMGNPWEEMFYVDLEAHLNADNMRQQSRNWRPFTRHLKCWAATQRVRTLKATQIWLS